MAMVGIEHVKTEFLKVKATIDAARTRKGRLRRQALNLALMGNPGTGKRTLAALYRQFLSDCGVWPTASPGLIQYKARSGSSFDIDDLDKDLADCRDGMVLYIDSIECMNSDHHAKLLNVLDWHAEKVVVVLSGSSKGVMQLLGSRPHGRWEFWRRLTLKDYSDEQLRLILLKLMHHNSLKLADGEHSRYPLVAAMRVGRNRGSEGFGNVHDLILSFEKMLDRHSARMDLEREAEVSTTDITAENDVLADDFQPENTEHNDDGPNDEHSTKSDDKSKVNERDIEKVGDEEAHVKVEDKNNTKTADQEPVDEAAVTEKVKNEDLVHQEVKNEEVEQEAIGDKKVETDRVENGEGKIEEVDEPKVRDKSAEDDKDKKIKNEEIEQKAIKDKIFDDDKDDQEETEEKDEKDRKVSKNDEVENEEGKSEEVEGQKVRDRGAGDCKDEEFKNEEVDNEEVKNGGVEPEEAKDKMANEEEAAENIDQAQPPRSYFLTMEDILGTEPMELQIQSDAWNELEKMAGLADVKKAVGELVDRARVNHRRELAGKERLHMSLNRLFLGPPGTGKSTVAKLYGQILADYGLVSNNEVVVKTPGDFISEYIGESETNTSAILDSTIGKVLIIDDAHMFYQEEGRKSRRTDDYRLGCLDVIVSKVHNKPGEDRCVILVGYTDGIQEMLRNTNPGLRRRFPLEQAFVFTDYNDEDLNQILRLKMAGEQITASQPAMDVAAEVLRRMRDRSNFGNGGDVSNLLDQAIARFVERTTREAERKKSEQEAINDNGDDKDNDDDNVNDNKADNVTQSLENNNGDENTTLEREDFDPEWNRGQGASEKCRLLFHGLIGFEVVIDQLQGYQRMAANMRRVGRDPRQRVPFTFLFKGPPGTGKTHTGRIVGQIFYDMGFLSSNEVVECSASHLISQWVGGTAPKVVDLLDRALGKVLLIDEAYRLAVKGSRSSGGLNYEEEAVGELVDALTKPRYLHKLVIVLAGYERGIDLLMRVNPGLRGRFATEIVFRPMTPRQCKTHLVNLIHKDGIAIRDGPEANDEDQKTVLLLFSKLALTPGWANARDVETLAGIIATDIYQMEPADLKMEDDADTETPFSISTKDLIEYLNGMMRQRVRESSK